MALMAKLEGLLPNFDRIGGKITDFIRGNPLVSTASVGAGAGVVGALVGSAVSKRRKKKSTSRKTGSRTKSRKTRKTRAKSKKKKTKYARTAGKRKDTSTRRIRQTKNGQPYIILKSGKARFISKRSARLSRKRKGGRY